MARTSEPAKEPRINFPIPRKLRTALNKKAKKEGRLVPAVLCDFATQYVSGGKK